MKRKSSRRGKKSINESLNKWRESREGERNKTSGRPTRSKPHCNEKCKQLLKEDQLLLFPSLIIKLILRGVASKKGKKDGRKARVPIAIRISEALPFLPSLFLFPPVPPQEINQ
mmetsp:Transcript_29942/g.58758  ORF Transcript_29942/g.58758 Transcript_29942/m.58758 type:complete len:114 (-) Transcript_29942:196-537(-)